MAYSPLILNRAIGGSARTGTKDNNTEARGIYSHNLPRRVATHALQQKSLLFDDLVGTGQQRPWNRNTDGPRGLEIDGEIEFHRLLDWQIVRIGAVQDFVNMFLRLPRVLGVLRFS
jgi:hypothetical protein